MTKIYTPESQKIDKCTDCPNFTKVTYNLWFCKELGADLSDDSDEFKIHPSDGGTGALFKDCPLPEAK